MKPALSIVLAILAVLLGLACVALIVAAIWTLDPYTADRFGSTGVVAFVLAVVAGAGSAMVAGK